MDPLHALLCALITSSIPDVTPLLLRTRNRMLGIVPMAPRLYVLCVSLSRGVDVIARHDADRPACSYVLFKARQPMRSLSSIRCTRSPTWRMRRWHRNTCLTCLP